MTPGDNPDRALVEALGADVTRCVATAIDGASRCALLDFPNHANSGDNAIWLGERAILDHLGCRVDLTADRHTYRPAPVRSLPAEVPVLLHGGGNLGDLWPAHAAHREQILSDLAGRRVVQLPQTVSERSSVHLGALDRLAEDLAGLHVLVRDRVSLERVRAFPNLSGVLCPDAAFALGPLERTVDPSFDIVWIQRADHERDHVYDDHGPRDVSIRVVDWLVTPDSPLRQRISASASVRVRSALFGTIGSRVPDRGAQALGSLFDPLARRRTNRALRLLSSGRVVITDRLHGHILALLLGIPHVLLDTSERKVAEFHDTFTNTSTLAHPATSPDDALEIARQLLRGVPT